MEMGLLIGQLLLKYGPDVVEMFVTLFHKETVTPEDWKALFAKARAKSYDDYVKAPEVK